MHILTPRALGSALFSLTALISCGKSPQESGESSAPPSPPNPQVGANATSQPTPISSDQYGCRGRTYWSFGTAPSAYKPTSSAYSMAEALVFTAGVFADSSAQPPVYNVIVTSVPSEARSLGLPDAYQVLGPFQQAPEHPVVQVDPAGQVDPGGMVVAVAFTSFSSPCGSTPSLSLLTLYDSCGNVARRTSIPGRPGLTALTVTSVTIDVPTRDLMVEGDKAGVLTDTDTAATTHFRAVWKGYLLGTGDGAPPDSVVTF